MRTSIITFLLILGCSVGLLKAQCMMQEVSLNDRCNEATLIIEGKILNKSCFWDAGHKNIFTKYAVETHKLFKGDSTNLKIEIVNPGGIVDSEMEQVSDAIPLSVGDYGIFMLKPGKVEFPAGFDPSVARYQVVAAAQGFVKYNMASQTAADVFHVYSDMDKEVYKAIEQYTGQHVKIIIAGNSSASVNGSRGLAILSFTPASTTSGTKSVLTIHGSGFGATRDTSSVSFSNADYGGIIYSKADATDYVSWSQNQIQVYVSDFAGNGNFQVNVAGSSATSLTALTITYARLDVVNPGVGSWQSNFIGPDNSGYKWIFNNQFPAAAKPAFMRAFDSWRCATLVNWTVDAVNTTTIGGSYQDNQNVITFDVDGDLPTGVLGRCSSLYFSCGNNIWYTRELDIVFSLAVSWNYSTNGPANNEADLESVVLHELGHGQGLGHVIDNNDVMNYSINYGQSRRVLNQYNIQCGQGVVNTSTANTYCSKPRMVAISASGCALPTAVENLTEANDFLNVFPNPSAGDFTLQFNPQLRNATCEIYNLVGQLVYQKVVNTNEKIHLAGGVYIVELKSAEGTMQKKLVVE